MRFSSDADIFRNCTNSMFTNAIPKTVLHDTPQYIKSLSRNSRSIDLSKLYRTVLYKTVPFAIS